jgi:hypothetical protein
MAQEGKAMTRQSLSAAAFVVPIVPQHFVTAARPGSNITEHEAIVGVSGDVAGLSADVSGNRHAVRWRSAGNWDIDLGTLDEGCCSQEFGINSYGELVGVSNLGQRGPRVSQHAFLAIATLAALRGDQFELESTIAFSSTRDEPTGQLLQASEIYLTSADFTNSRRLTSNTAGDIFPSLSPDGTKVVFESNRNRTEEPLNTSDLFVMNTDDTEQTPLARGSCATWSPDSKTIAFHASASGGEKRMSQ